MLNRRFHGAVLVRAAVVALGVATAGGVHAQTLAQQTAREVVLHLKNADSLGPVRDELTAANDVVDQIPRRPVYLLRFQSATDAQQAVSILKDCTDVVFAELNQLVTSDPWLHKPDNEAVLNSVLAIGEGMNCLGDGGSKDCEPQAVEDLLRLDVAHPVSTGSGVRVAVLDTGYDPDHRHFFDMAVAAERDFIDRKDEATEGGTPVRRIEDFGPSSVGHGTHVTGIVHRVAPHAELMIGRVLDPSGAGTTWWTAKGIFWAIDPNADDHFGDGAHVVNLSLDTRADTETLRLAAGVVSCHAVPQTGAWQANITRCTDQMRQTVIVAAAGNDASSNAKLYPAAYSHFMPGLLAVAASDNRPSLVRAPAFFTNSGVYVDVAAPGYGIYSQFFDDSVAWISGTSMAAPMVSGLAALVRSYSAGSWRASAIVDRIRTRSVKMCGPNAPTNFRHIDVAATIDAAEPLGDCPLVLTPVQR